MTCIGHSFSTNTSNKRGVESYESKRDCSFPHFFKRNEFMKLAESDWGERDKEDIGYINTFLYHVLRYIQCATMIRSVAPREGLRNHCRALYIQDNSI